MTSRIEIFLKAIKTGNISNLPIPKSRIEHFLKGIATGNISDLPMPKSRVEEVLNYIAINGISSSNGGSGNDNNNVGSKISISDKVDIELIEI